MVGRSSFSGWQNSLDDEYVIWLLKLYFYPSTDFASSKDSRFYLMVLSASSYNVLTDELMNWILEDSSRSRYWACYTDLILNSIQFFLIFPLYNFILSLMRSTLLCTFKMRVFLIWEIYIVSAFIIGASRTSSLTNPTTPIIFMRSLIDNPLYS